MKIARILQRARFKLHVYAYKTDGGCSSELDICFIFLFFRPLWDEKLVTQEYRVLPEPPNNWVGVTLHPNQAI